VAKVDLAKILGVEDNLLVDIVSIVGAEHFLLVNPVRDPIEHGVGQTIFDINSYEDHIRKVNVNAESVKKQASLLKCLVTQKNKQASFQRVSCKKDSKIPLTGHTMQKNGLSSDSERTKKCLNDDHHWQKCPER